LNEQVCARDQLWLSLVASFTSRVTSTEPGSATAVIRLARLTGPYHSPEREKADEPTWF
jgi:hypothetical protein